LAVSIYDICLNFQGNPSADSADVDKNENDNEIESNSEDCYLSQNDPQNTENIMLITDSPKYGFANKISKALTVFEVYICFYFL